MFDEFLIAVVQDFYCNKITRKNEAWRITRKNENFYDDKITRNDKSLETTRKSSGQLLLVYAALSYSCMRP